MHSYCVTVVKDYFVLNVTFLLKKEKDGGIYVQHLSMLFFVVEIWKYLNSFGDVCK